MSDQTPEEFLDQYDKLKPRVIIDKHALDEELIQQPHLFQLVAEQYVLAVSYRDLARQMVKNTESTLSIRFRREAVELREKVTEAGLEAMISSHKDYREAYMDYLGWKAVADQFEALRESFSQRAYALRDLVSLHTAGYYSNSTGAGAREEAKTKIAEQVRQHQAEQRVKRNI